MKKLTLISFLMICLGIFVNAQSLATFENLDEDNLYLSDYGASGDPFWYDDGRFVEGGLPQIATNPDKSGINTSDKCVFAINAADADWWGNFTVLGLKTPIKITEVNRYLHFKVYRSIQPKEFRIGFNDREEVGQVFQGKAPNDGQWESIVCDLGARFMDQDLEYIHIIHSTNWSDPRTGWGVATYAYDDFALSDSPIPPSVTLKDGNGLFVGFDNQTVTDEWIKEIDLLNPANTAEIIDNPFEVNNLTGNKIVKFNKSADAAWWQGYRMDFAGVMPVGDDNPSFLHVLTYVPAAIFDADPELMNIDIQLCAKDHMGKESTSITSVWDDEVDKWHDLILEINSIQYLKELTVRFDVRKDQNDNYVNSPANTFYLDAVAFDKNAEPREMIVGGTANILAQRFANVVAYENAIQVSSDVEFNVEVYNIIGKNVFSSKTISDVTIPVDSKGVYFVKLSSKTNKQQFEKILVK